ncbi:hypothetical protein EV360DRAFT_77078 [Lentinula raphanica]|nr:hypothetical protein EV360DRAFT_77149 [Lentinula raphanica]KAJ3738162.1 hypothetical protein EV360DRAFT_77078 [Lentinula raphanica]
MTREPPVLPRLRPRLPLPPTRMTLTSTATLTLWLYDLQREACAVREKKAAQIKKLYESYRSKVEVMIIDDISTAQFPETPKGLNATIHTAAPLAYAASDAEGQLKGAVEGVLDVLRQAEIAKPKTAYMAAKILAEKDVWSL